MVDRSGITFAFRLNEETGASVPDITAAWLVAREVFDMPGFWAQLEALDGKVDTSAQILRAARGPQADRAGGPVAAALPPAAVRHPGHHRLLRRRRADRRRRAAEAAGRARPGRLRGAPRRVRQPRRARRAWPTGSPRWCPRTRRSTSSRSRRSTGRSVEETAEVYFDLADRLQITRLRDRITALPRDDRWNTMARGALRDDLYTAHAALARDVLTVTGPGTPEERLAAWVAAERVGGAAGPPRRWPRSGRATRSPWRRCRSRSGRSGRWSPQHAADTRPGAIARRPGAA